MFALLKPFPSPIIVEIEQDLTRTQETNINLQIRLENAVTRQRESDGHATRAIRDLHSDLAMVCMH